MTALDSSFSFLIDGFQQAAEGETAAGHAGGS
jgi:hypothetical protein